MHLAWRHGPGRPPGARACLRSSCRGVRAIAVIGASAAPAFQKESSHSSHVFPDPRATRDAEHACSWLRARPSVQRCPWVSRGERNFLRIFKRRELFQTVNQSMQFFQSAVLRQNFISPVLTENAPPGLEGLRASLASGKDSGPRGACRWRTRTRTGARR